MALVLLMHRTVQSAGAWTSASKTKDLHLELRTAFAWGSFDSISKGFELHLPSLSLLAQSNSEPQHLSLLEGGAIIQYE
jgi:hypothetical protein